MDKEEFLKEKVYYGLTNLNDGFDSPQIWYFNKADFEILLDRVEKLKMGICGIECWPDKRFGTIKVHELYDMSLFDPKWYRRAFQELLDEGFESYFSVSFLFSDDLNF